MLSLFTVYMVLVLSWSVIQLLVKYYEHACIVTDRTILSVLHNNCYVLCVTSIILLLTLCHMPTLH
jgi:hypothetical protein